MEKIVKETLISLQEYLPRLINGCSQVVDNLKEGDEGSGLRKMPSIVEGMQWVFEAVSGIQNNGFLHNIYLHSLKEHFKEVVKALEIGDYVLLADVLNYEILPVLEEWLEIAEELA
ncbi:hypothetical protein [Aquibacillus kalidii]|uniref:hypothetical protein n=1 Tax=Aquibacillus kalidii TaxID=2762597 RepID=UPI00164785A4|nr:hypothetical protein [Aquibacillus kalidii]